MQDIRHSTIATEIHRQTPQERKDVQMRAEEPDTGWNTKHCKVNLKGIMELWIVADIVFGGCCSWQPRVADSVPSNALCDSTAESGG